ncbi:MAG: dephospho-CoA kinase, partial [Chloroflexi bacterium]|nr:dephospho-CoA kinase [Chloroflexota bacterium]
MLVIGLTGGIASGKTTVSGILKELGACVLDADRVGHEAYLPNTQTWREVVAAFGEEILTPDNEIDRGKLGALVFKVPANMKKLTDIMW